MQLGKDSTQLHTQFCFKLYRLNPTSNALSFETIVSIADFPLVYVLNTRLQTQTALLQLTGLLITQSHIVKQLKSQHLIPP